MPPCHREYGVACGAYRISYIRLCEDAISEVLHEVSYRIVLEAVLLTLKVKFTRVWALI